VPPAADREQGVEATEGRVERGHGPC
jgi:hypothetical protein